MAAAKSTIIPPFPDSIDRCRFGSYISGFVDGEGSFALNRAKRSKSHKGFSTHPIAGFTIMLRADDRPILELIRSYFQCGSLYYVHVRHNRAPTYSFTVRRLSDLVETIIPHFEAYPLYAKKGKDFAIWKEGVLFLNAIASRKGQVKANNDGKLVGKHHRWTDREHEEFDVIAARLRGVRVYVGPSQEDLITESLVRSRTDPRHRVPQLVLPGFD